MSDDKIRITWAFPDGPYVLSEQAIRYPAPGSKFQGAECMCAGVLRRATVEDLAEWRNG